MCFKKRFGPESVFDDAVAMWRMDNPSEFELSGKVTCGVELTGAERSASLIRGGSGRAALFDGGYLTTGIEFPVDLSGAREMSLSIRLIDFNGKWDSPLFSRCAADDNHSGILYSSMVNKDFVNQDALKRLKSDKTLEFAWRTEPFKNRVKPEFVGTDWHKELFRLSGTDLEDGIMRVGVPVDIVGPETWHDVVIRFNNANLELFVDGVLVDEEWPHGSLYCFRSPFLIGAGFKNGAIKSGFHGMIEHVALWRRALSDDEIKLLRGGPENVAKRENEIFGINSGNLQYWVPRGYNTFVGDCMPFYHDGVFHLYYLLDRRRHRSKWGMGAHQFAHSSSRDLVHWHHHPLSLPLSEQWECSMGTGCVVFHEGRYHEFYIHHGKRAYFKDAPHIRETIHEAVGDDGIHFTKKPEPVAPMDYRDFEDVNPDIFPDASGDGYNMSISGWKFFSAANLKNWKENTEFKSPRDIPRWICCTVFEWNGWHYFAGSGRYRFSRDPVAPGWRWTEPAHPATSDGLGVPKIAAFTGNRYLLAGFFGPGFGGELVFRELVQHDDGTLGTKFPPEMIPAAGDPVLMPFMMNGKKISDSSRAAVNAGAGRAFGYFEGVPQNVRITATVRPEPGVSGFGLCFRGNGSYDSGYELSFDPGRGCVGFFAVENGLRASEPARGIGDVADLDKPFALDVIVKNNLVDVSIGECRTIISRFSKPLEGERLFIFSNNGNVSFENVQIRQLLL